MRSRNRKGLFRDGNTGACDELSSLFFSSDAHRRSDDRKLKQICREVYRVLVNLVPGESRDPILAGIHVVDVIPAPDASRLAVLVHAEPGSDLRQITDHLTAWRGYLRAEIAAAIQHKKTPELTFEVTP